MPTDIRNEIVRRHSVNLSTCWLWYYLFGIAYREMDGEFDQRNSEIVFKLLCEDLDCHKKAVEHGQVWRPHSCLVNAVNSLNDDYKERVLNSKMLDIVGGQELLLQVIGRLPAEKRLKYINYDYLNPKHLMREKSLLGVADIIADIPSDVLSDEERAKVYKNYWIPSSKLDYFEKRVMESFSDKDAIDSFYSEYYAYHSIFMPAASVSDSFCERVLSFNDWQRKIIASRLAHVLTDDQFIRVLPEINLDDYRSIYIHYSVPRK